MQFGSLACTLDYYAAGTCSSPSQLLQSTDLRMAVNNLSEPSLLLLTTHFSAVNIHSFFFVSRFAARKLWNEEASSCIDGGTGGLCACYGLLTDADPVRGRGMYVVEV